MSSLLVETLTTINVVFSVSYSGGIITNLFQELDLINKMSFFGSSSSLFLDLNVNRGDCYFKIKCSPDNTTSQRLCGNIVGTFLYKQIACRPFLVIRIHLREAQVHHMEIYIKSPRKSLRLQKMLFVVLPMHTAKLKVCHWGL